MLPMIIFFFGPILVGAVLIQFNLMPYEYRYDGKNWQFMLLFTAPVCGAFSAIVFTVYALIAALINSMTCEA